VCDRTMTFLQKKYILVAIFPSMTCSCVGPTVMVICLCSSYLRKGDILGLFLWVLSPDSKLSKVYLWS
jgi:hypothetical protein